MPREQMDLITWSPTYSVGVKLIDEQHRGLLELVNDMFNHVVGDEKAEHEYFKMVIDEAVRYVKVHFQTEEKIMIHTHFPGYMEHKKAHDTFVLNVVKQAREFEANKKITLTEFIRFLKEWILTHIAIMDKQYFTYFRKIASRKSDGRLSINRDDIGVK
jgi:hemerythrin